MAAMVVGEGGVGYSGVGGGGEVIDLIYIESPGSNHELMGQ